MQDDVTLLYLHSSASSNGEKEVQSSRKDQCFHFNIADVSQFKCHHVCSRWPLTHTKVMMQHDVQPTDNSRCPWPVFWYFLDLCDLFTEPVTVRWDCLLLQHFVSKKLSVFMAFCCFWRERKGCWYSKRLTHPSSLLIHFIFHCTGKALAPVSGTGAERGRKQCLEFVKKKNKKNTWVIPTCQTQAELLLFPNELRWFF